MIRGGFIAISIGVLVDGAIVEVENAYNRIYHWQEGGRFGFKNYPAEFWHYDYVR